MLVVAQAMILMMAVEGAVVAAGAREGAAIVMLVMVGAVTAMIAVTVKAIRKAAAWEVKLVRLADRVTSSTTVCFKGYGSSSMLMVFQGLWLRGALP